MERTFVRPGHFSLTEGRMCNLAVALAFACASLSAVLGVAGTTAGANVTTAPGSSTKVVFWTNMSDLESMTDSQLSQWQQDGVGGFVGEMGLLPGTGSTQELTGNLAAVSGSNYSLEQALESSNIVARAHALGMKLYLGFYLSNFFNTQTPLAEWFDDSTWANTVLPAVQGAAAAAQVMGFDGIGMDQELYPQQGGAQSATWDWDYPGNTHSEAQVRAEATMRGQQMMQAITSVFPNVEIVDYDASFPDSWDAHVQQVENGVGDAFSDNLDVNFWDGMTSIEGYSGIWFYDENFYKTYSPANSWASALSYYENSLYAYFSQNFSDWSYASSRVFPTPSAWIDGDGGGAYTAPRPSDYVADQLQAFRDWSPGGQFAVYAYSGMNGFDYTPYVGGIQASSAPAVADSDPPTIAITAEQTNAGSLALNGTANDDYAIEDVRWSSSSGAGGTALDTWQVLSGNDQSGYQGQTDWSIPQVPLGSGSNGITVTAEDTHGLTSAVTIGGGSGSAISFGDGAGETAFVNLTYQDLLGRPPDSGGLGTWLAALSSGMSRSQFAYDIATSAEYRTRLIGDIYSRYLGRGPDPSGFYALLGLLNAGTSDETAIADVVGSTEFFDDAGADDSGFVALAYQTILQRAPDPAGMSTFLGLLASGTSRTAVALDLLTSSEYFADQVAGGYEAFLQRAPDQAGLTTWVAYLSSGATDEQVIEQLLGSAEFFDLANT